MFMLIYALCYLPGHIVPELLFRCVTLAARNRNFGFRSRAGKFSTNAMVRSRGSFRPRQYQTTMCTLGSLVIPIVRFEESMPCSKRATRRGVQNRMYYNNASSQLGCEKMNWNETVSYCVLIFFYQIRICRKNLL